MSDAQDREALATRLWSRVVKTETCWLWIGSTCRDGYGHLSFNSQRLRVHRVAYELLVGPIPEGLVIDHLCRVRHCVNPEHMEPVTNAENVLRGEGPSAKAARQSQCGSGHPFDDVNTRINADGSRACRACHRESAARNRGRVECPECGMEIDKSQRQRHLRRKHPDTYLRERAGRMAGEGT